MWAQFIVEYYFYEIPKLGNLIEDRILIWEIIQTDVDFMTRGFGLDIYLKGS